MKYGITKGRLRMSNDIDNKGALVTIDKIAS